MPGGSPPAAAQDVLRWYTRALRIPRLLGKAPGGGSWPGGPYTLTQGVGGGLTFVLAQKTMDVWGRFGVVGNLAALCGVTAAVLFGLRFVRSGGRDPVTATVAVLGLMSRPTSGRYAGRTVRFTKPHQVRHRINVLLPPNQVAGCTSPPAQAPTAAETAPAHQRPAPGPERPPAREHPRLGRRRLRVPTAPRTESPATPSVAAPSHVSRLLAQAEKVEDVA